jgi:ATP-dependent exoDNAse (exonuclease V) beta subunit
MLVINSNQHVSAEFFNSELVKENVNNLLRQRFGDKIASPANVSLYELTENIIKAFGLNSVPDAYLLRFQDAVLEYSAQSGNSIVNFLDWWETKQKDISIITPRSNIAVRIMTIHKAKGLESPVVIIPYANWDLDIDGKKDFFWVTSRETPYEKFSPAYYLRASDGLAKTYFSRQYYEEAIAVNTDNLNLLYVAFTRASERLYVLCPQRGNSSLETDKIGKSINEHKRINAAQLIKYIIATDERLNKYYDEPKDVFKFGTEASIEGKRMSEQTIPITEYISSDWFRKLIVKS